MFHDAEGSIDTRDLLEEFINGFVSGWTLGSIAIIVALLANATLLQMYIALAGISIVLGVIQTVISACKGDDFGIILNAIFTALSVITFAKLWGYKQAVRIKSSDGSEKVIEVNEETGEGSYRREN